MEDTVVTQVGVKVGIDWQAQGSGMGACRAIGYTLTCAKALTRVRQPTACSARDMPIYLLLQPERSLHLPARLHELTAIVKVACGYVCTLNIYGRFD